MFMNKERAKSEKLSQGSIIVGLGIILFNVIFFFGELVRHLIGFGKWVWGTFVQVALLALLIFSFIFLVILVFLIFLAFSFVVGSVYYWLKDMVFKK